jgi:hypothetical protein
MSEYEEKIRAHKDLLRRVEEQYPEIRARVTDSEPNGDLGESHMQEADDHMKAQSLNGSEKTNSGEIVSEGKSYSKESGSRKRIHRHKRRSTRYYKSPRANVTSQSPVDRLNSNNRRAYEKQKREYERQVHEHERRQKEIEKCNSAIRKEYERQRAEVQKHNAEVRKRNKDIRQSNAERRARYNAHQQNSRRGSKYIEYKTYLQDEYPERPYHQRWQIDQGWDSVSGGGGNSRRQNYNRQRMPNQRRRRY